MGFFSKLGEKIDKGISWIGQQLKKFATLAADFFRRVKDGIRKFAMIIGKFFSLLAKWLDTAIQYVEATFRVIVSGVQTFLKKVGNEYQQLSYNYTRQDDGTFLKNTVVNRSMYRKMRFRQTSESRHSSWQTAKWWTLQKQRQKEKKKHARSWV